MIPLPSFYTSIWTTEFCRHLSCANQLIWSQAARAWYSYMIVCTTLGYEQLSLITGMQMTTREQ